MEGPAVSPAAIGLSSSSNNLIWTRLTLSRPFGTQFVSEVPTHGPVKALGFLLRELAKLPVDEYFVRDAPGSYQPPAESQHARS